MEPTTTLCTVNGRLESLCLFTPLATVATRGLRSQWGRVLPAEPYPVDALGPSLSEAARAIHEKTQAPIAICAQSVLAAATLAVQGHCDVTTPHGSVIPTSIYFVTLANSGERKSTADKEALVGVEEYTVALEEQYAEDYRGWRDEHEAWETDRAKIKKKLSGDALAQALGALKEPVEPMKPTLTFGEPTLEGITRAFKEGRPSQGIFSTEGGQFFHGHAMNEENRIKTLAGLSGLWDGKTIDRSRGGDGNYRLRGRRLALHLLIQPEVADALLCDPLARSQGFLSRILPVLPDSASGSRPFCLPTDSQIRRIRRFASVLAENFESPLPFKLPGSRELTPRQIHLSKIAETLWIEFYNHVESSLKSNGFFASIREFGNKLAEHALRLAAVIELHSNLNAPEIQQKTMADAIILAQHYAAETLRIAERGAIPEHLKDAQTLLDWLDNTWKEPKNLISTSDIEHAGPGSLRSAKKTKEVCTTLETCGELTFVGEGVVNGIKRNKVYRITKKAGSDR